MSTTAFAEVLGAIHDLEATAPGFAAGAGHNGKSDFLEAVRILTEEAAA